MVESVFVEIFAGLVVHCSFCLHNGDNEIISILHTNGGGMQYHRLIEKRYDLQHG